MSRTHGSYCRVLERLQPPWLSGDLLAPAGPSRPVLPAAHDDGASQVATASGAAGSVLSAAATVTADSPATGRRLTLPPEATLVQLESGAPAAAAPGGPPRPPRTAGP